MIQTKNYTVFTTTDDIQRNYRQFNGKRIKFSAIIKRVSVRLSFILAETYNGDVKIRITKQSADQLDRLNNIIDDDGKFKARVIVEGEPHYCSFRHSVGIKKGNVLEIYGTITK